MRPQYHFRPSPHGMLIWNVAHLVELARDLPVFDLPLSEVRELDEAYWFAATGDLPTCRAIAAHMALVQQADTAWPILLCSEGRVMDGMHRVTRALLDGRPSVPARRFPTTPPEDFRDIDPDDLPY